VGALSIQENPVEESGDSSGRCGSLLCAKVYHEDLCGPSLMVDNVRDPPID
jgi:hypothetical protein